MRRAAFLAVVLQAASSAHIDRLRAVRVVRLGAARALSATLRDPIVPKLGALVLAAAQDRGFRNESIKAHVSLIRWQENN